MANSRIQLSFLFESRELRGVQLVPTHLGYSVELEEAADIRDVAADIRNHAPGVIIACCGSVANATKFADALAIEPLGDPGFRKNPWSRGKATGPE